MRWDTEKFPTPDSHVYSENGAEIMVYNIKRPSKKKGGTGEKREKKKGRRNITRKREKL